MKKNFIADVIKHSTKGGHPRIMLTDEDIRRMSASSDPIYVNGIKNMIKKADEYLNKPTEEYIIPDGIRLLETSRRVLRTVLILGLAYRFSGEDRYAERLYKELLSVAGFKDWNPRHFLDVGEMSCAVGIGYDWIYNWMNEEMRSVIRRAIVEKGVMQVMDDYLDRDRSRTYRWYQANPGNNWKYVCNGGLAVAILAICDEDDMDRELLNDALNYGFDSCYRGVRDMYMPDGSYVEGFTYWTYATNYLAHFTCALKSATGGDYGLTDYEPVIKSAYYVKYMSSNRFYAFNFGDAPEVSQLTSVFLWIGDNYGEGNITDMRADFLRKNPGHVSFNDMLWYKPASGEGEVEPPLDYGSVGGSNASFRSGWCEGDLYGAIHFGENDVSHAHADTGSFVLEYGGKRFINDLGPDNYNVGNYRNAYRYRAEGHNTLVINPDSGADQARDSHCFIDVYREGDGRCDSIAVCDISAAYFGKGVVRGMRMTADRGALIIQDELSIDPTDNGYWFAHTKADITLAEDRRSAVFDMDGVRLWAGVLAEGEFEVMAAEHLCPELVQPDQNDNSDFKKLAIRFSGASTLSVAFLPLSEGQSAPVSIPEYKEIANW